MKKSATLFFLFFALSVVFALPVAADSDTGDEKSEFNSENSIMGSNLSKAAQEDSIRLNSSRSTQHNEIFLSKQLGINDDMDNSDDAIDSNSSFEISPEKEMEQVGRSALDEEYSPNSWLKIGSKTYYAGTDGKLVKGVQNIGGDYYYFDPSTGMLKTDSGWINYNGNLYHSSNGGKLYKGRFIHYSVKSNYYLNPNATVGRGMVNVGSNTYYADPVNGEILKKARWVDYNGNRYHTDKNGALYKNRSIHYSAASDYYLDKDGRLLRGIVSMNSKDYFADPHTGEVLKKARWVDYNGNRYHTDKNAEL